MHNRVCLGPKIIRVERHMHCTKLTRGFNGVNFHTALRKAFQMLKAPTPCYRLTVVQASLRVVGVPTRSGGMCWVKFLLPSRKRREKIAHVRGDAWSAPPFGRISFSSQVPDASKHAGSGLDPQGVNAKIECLISKPPAVGWEFINATVVCCMILWYSLLTRVL